MVGRVVEIATDGRHLSVQRGFLVVSEHGAEVGRVPIDDIAAVVANAHGLSCTNNALIEANRFLWLVRCHLHHLAGHAEDRLSAELQPSVAHRLGLAGPRGAVAAPSLLDHFRHHAQNVLKAATRSAAALPLLLHQ